MKIKNLSSSTINVPSKRRNKINIFGRFRRLFNFKESTKLLNSTEFEENFLKNRMQDSGKSSSETSMEKQIGSNSFQIKFTQINKYKGTLKI